MKTEVTPFKVMFLYAAFLFLFGFIAFFYTKRLKDWHIKILNILHKKRLVLFYDFQLNMAKTKFFIINSKIVGFVMMLAGIFLFALLIRVMYQTC